MSSFVGLTNHREVVIFVLNNHALLLQIYIQLTNKNIENIIN